MNLPLVKFGQSSPLGPVLCKFWHMSMVKVVSMWEGGRSSVVTTDFGPPKGERSHFMPLSRACVQSIFEAAVKEGRRRLNSAEDVVVACRDIRMVRAI